MHEVLVNRLGGLSLPRKSVVRLTDRPDMTLDVYRGRKTTIQQQQQQMVALTLLHSERPTLYTILAFPSAVGLKYMNIHYCCCNSKLTLHNKKKKYFHKYIIYSQII